MSEEKVDIFKLLKHIDAGDVEYYDNLSDAEKKSVSMFVTNRWLSCTKNSKQLITVNALVNPFVFAFGTQHAGLLYKLMVIASSGTEKNYKWVGRKKNISSKPETAGLLSAYYGISKRVAEGYLPMFTLDEALELASDLGYDAPSMKKLKNEFK